MFFYRKGKRYQAGHVAWMPSAFCLRNMVKRQLPMREEDLSLPQQVLSDIPGKGIQNRNGCQKARHSGSHEHTVNESLFRTSHS